MIHHDAQPMNSTLHKTPSTREVHVCWAHKRDCWHVLARADTLHRLDISWALNRTRCKAKLAGLRFVSR